MGITRFGASGAARPDATPSRPHQAFLEFALVRLKEAQRVEGSILPRGSLGTIVDVIGDGQSFFVEFDTAGSPVTAVPAECLEQA